MIEKRDKRILQLEKRLEDKETQMRVRRLPRAPFHVWFCTLLLHLALFLVLFCFVLLLCVWLCNPLWFREWGLGDGCPFPCRSQLTRVLCLDGRCFYVFILFCLFFVPPVSGTGGPIRAPY